jgi:hypothetical protein
MGTLKKQFVFVIDAGWGRSGMIIDNGNSIRAAVFVACEKSMKNTLMPKQGGCTETELRFDQIRT